VTEIVDRCAVCQRRIRRQRWRLVTKGAACCTHCANERSRHAHKIVYPDCPVDWHDMFDHDAVFADCRSCALSSSKYQNTKR
jgi:hypothetical protein